MKATIQRVRECIGSGPFFKVSCKDFVINSRQSFKNGELVILAEGKETFLLKLSKMFDFRPEESNMSFEIGEDVTEYIPEELLKV